ncbi:hypothetical protein P8452_69242 [Trifolium repens]|nr:hypothetical protein P8452_69242 [Trifolium repens]
MTTFNGFYVVVTIMISFSLFFKTSLCSEIPQTPSYAPRPLSSYEKYLSNCASKLKPAECGQEIFKKKLKAPFSTFFTFQSFENALRNGSVTV